MGQLYARGAIYVTDTTAVTGSFSSVQVAGTIAAASVGGEAEFANIQFGKASADGTTNTSPSSSGTVVMAVELSGSAVIPGPIYGFKLTNGSALAYYMNEDK